jgi:hypothetical protein
MIVSTVLSPCETRLTRDTTTMADGKRASTA